MHSSYPSSEPVNRELYEELLNEGASEEEAAGIARSVAETQERMRRAATDSGQTGR